jgi:integrase
MKPTKGNADDAGTTCEVNFQSVKSSDTTVSIIAYITYGYGIVNPTHAYVETEGKDLSDYDKSSLLMKKAKKYFSRIDYKPTKVATGVVLPTMYWDNKKKKATGIYTTVNKTLKEFIANSKKLYSAMSRQGTRTVEPKDLSKQVKKLITEKIKNNQRILQGKKPNSKIKLQKIVIPGYFENPEVNGIPTRLQDYIQYKIEKYRSQGPVVSGLTKQTLKIYLRLKSHVEHYTKHTGIEINMETISSDAVGLLINYFIKKKKENGNDYSYSYLSWMKKEIKNFINKAKADKINVPVNFYEEKKYWKVHFPKKNDPYLTLHQLKILRDKDFKKLTVEEKLLIKNTLKADISEDVLDTTRDYFLIAANSAMRYSDLKMLRNIYEYDKGKWQFDYVSKKTKKRVKVPIREQYIIDMYLEKYKREFNLNIQEQTFNRALKACCLVAGLTEPINVSEIDVNTKDEKSYDVPLWSKVTSKTGRKSYATNEFEVYHTSLSIIQLQTGHSNEKTLRAYIQLKDEDFFRIHKKQVDEQAELQAYRANKN